MGHQLGVRGATELGTVHSRISALSRTIYMNPEVNESCFFILSISNDNVIQDILK